MPALKDSVVLLTGGATGIGRAIALDMAAAGATVAIGDTNVDGGRQTAEEILSAGGRASFRSCDVANAEQVAALVGGAVAGFGQLDVLSTTPASPAGHIASMSSTSTRGTGRSPSTCAGPSCAPGQ